MYNPSLFFMSSISLNHLYFIQSAMRALKDIFITKASLYRYINNNFIRSNIS